MSDQATLKQELIHTIAQWVCKSGLSQREAARCLGVYQPMVNEIMHGRCRYGLGRLIDAWAHSGGECRLVTTRKLLKASSGKAPPQS